MQLDYAFPKIGFWKDGAGTSTATELKLYLIRVGVFYVCALTVFVLWVYVRDAFWHCLASGVGNKGGKDEAKYACLTQNALHYTVLYSITTWDLRFDCYVTHKVKRTKILRGMDQI